MGFSYILILSALYLLQARNQVLMFKGEDYIFTGASF